MLSCIMFRRNHKEYKKNDQKVKEIDDKKYEKDEISGCEPTIDMIECESTITCEPVIEGNIVNKESSILNMINKEYERIEKIRLEKDKLINLPGTCDRSEKSDIVYKRNIYIMEEDNINKQILQLLQY